jgi:acyl carrier protein
MTNVAEQINDYIVRELMSDKPGTTVANDEHLIDGGIIDSLGIFLVIGFIDSTFNVKVEPEDVVLENFQTVNAIRDLVLARQATVSGAPS